MNKIATMISGNTRMTLSAILPLPETASRLLMFVDAQKANGMQTTAATTVPRMEMTSVSSSPRSKSSPSGI